MKYFIRAVKSLLYFVVVFAVIVSILYLVIERPKGIALTDMFQEGSLPKLVLFFVAFGAVYPAVSFFKRKLYANGDYAKYRPTILAAMEELGYEVEKESPAVVTFRQSKPLQRLFRLFCEDRITINVGDNPFVVEGYRKDVMRVVSLLSYRLREAE